jgi:hypothetical protein
VCVGGGIMHREFVIEFSYTCGASLNQLYSLCVMCSFLTLLIPSFDDFRKCDSSEILLQEKMLSYCNVHLPGNFTFGGGCNISAQT